MEYRTDELNNKMPSAITEIRSHSTHHKEEEKKKIINRLMGKRKQEKIISHNEVL